MRQYVPEGGNAVLPCVREPEGTADSVGFLSASPMAQRVLRPVPCIDLRSFFSRS